MDNTKTLCKKCGGQLILWKDIFNRFPHFWQCTKCNAKFSLNGQAELDENSLTEVQKLMLEELVKNRK